MKYILIALTLLNTIGLFAQVSISEGVFENGLSYPVLSDKYDSTKYEIINKDILSGLKDLESNLYCISDYGYVQKGNHIQLQVMCTCMEMDKGELRFFFYNLETGMPVKYSDLFDLKSKDKAMKYLDNKVSSFISVNSNECINSLKQEKSLKFDDLNVRMTREGLEIRSTITDSCKNSPLKVNWSELKDYLKYKFI